MSYANWSPTSFYLVGDYVYNLSGDYYYAVADNYNSPPPSAPWVLVTTGTFAPSYAEFTSSTTQPITAMIELPITNDTKTIGTADIVPVGPFPTSGMRVNTTGVYKLLYSAQMNKSSGGGADDIDIYLRINGTNVPNTATRVALTQQIEQVLTCEYIESLTAGDVVEFVAYTSVGVSCEILAVPAAPPVPAIPSIITNIIRIA
jgi:hypothetical protein